MNHLGKRSKWYPMSVRPTMAGWYEFTWNAGSIVLMREFDGRSWRYGLGNGMHWNVFRGQNAQWRGLAEEPK